MKLFISQAMRDKTDEQIKQERNKAIHCYGILVKALKCWAKLMLCTLAKIGRNATDVLLNMNARFVMAKSVFIINQYGGNMIKKRKRLIARIKKLYMSRQDVLRLYDDKHKRWYLLVH